MVDRLKAAYRGLINQSTHTSAVTTPIKTSLGKQKVGLGAVHALCGTMGTKTTDQHSRIPSLNHEPSYVYNVPLSLDDFFVK